jgi:tetratricopeptide (TPR) repeat protein
MAEAPDAVPPERLLSLAVKLFGLVVGLGLIVWGVLGMLGRTPQAAAEAVKLLNEATDHATAGELAEAWPLFDRAQELAHRGRQAARDAETQSKLRLIESDAYYYEAAFRLRHLQERYREERNAAVREDRDYTLPDGPLQEPVDLLKQSLELDPSRAEAHFYLGWAYREQEKNLRAIEALQRAVELDPQFARAHNALGEVYFATRQYEKAKEHYEKAVLLDPQLAGAHLNLGLYYAGRMAREDAADAADRARQHLNRYLALAETRPGESPVDIARARRTLGELPAAEGE